VGWARNEDRSLGTRGSWGRVSLQEVCPLLHPGIGIHPNGRDDAVPRKILCLFASLGYDTDGRLRRRQKGHMSEHKGEGGGG
jgi:hypothetical protein